MKVVLILANSSDHDEMQCYAAFHLGLHCLPKFSCRGSSRLAQVLKTIFHQCVISYTCSQSNSDGSVELITEPSELDWLQVYDMTH